MAEEVKKKLATVRCDPEVYFEAKYYMSLEGCSVTSFLEAKLVEFVHNYRLAHPTRVPRGVQDCDVAFLE